MKQLNDVIAAIATPIGEGGIAVIRVSGKGSIEVADAGFRGSTKLQAAQTHSLHYGQYVDGRGDVIDEVVAAVFRAPRSYTAEDAVEISCHGGLYVSRKILEAVIANGARLAEPGEFTKRAFLNGRIDLSQAEAVADLIKSRSELALKSSVLQLQGSLSRRIHELRSRLIYICGLVELELDFIEENITFTSIDSLQSEIEQIVADLQSLVHSFSYGRLYREGVKVVLVGRPNTGKSSLLNTLLDQNRAIVTNIPGTTRDVIEETIVLEGMQFRLVDTAGIRPTEDTIEREGVRRTHEQIKEADICLYVLDVSENNLTGDLEFIHLVKSIRNGSNPIEIIVGNKTDLIDSKSLVLNKFNRCFGGTEKIFVSALTKVGLDNLTKALVKSCSQSSLNVNENSVVITNERHKSALNNAIESLRLALESIKEAKTGEVIAVDLRGALDALGAIVGEVTTDDILNDIFSKFCIGK